ncbi:MAG TPA: hypothetical protein EYQ50_25195 [Verrucomicrobiales bacterium]|jgi:hypothetical protein|nr:hypothetical protein [Verrucomicrobiales bacterium]
MKNIITHIVALCLFTTLFTSPQQIFAAQEKAKKPTEAIKKPAKESVRKKRIGFPFNGKVSKIHKDKNSFTIKGKTTTRVFYLTKKSKVVKHGKPAKLSDVKIGEAVGGIVKRKGKGKNEYEVLSVRFGPKPAKKTGSKKKAKPVAVKPSGL